MALPAAERHLLQDGRARASAAVVVVVAAALPVIVAIVLVSSGPTSAVLCTTALIAMVLVNRSRLDAVSVQSVFVALIFLVPSYLVFAPLGAAGSPSTLAGLGALWLWCINLVAPTLGGDTGRSPVRVTVLAFALCAGLSYIAAVMRPLGVLELSAADRGAITIASVTGIALLATDAIPNRIRLEVLVRWIVLGGGVVALVGIFQFLFGVDLAAAIRIPGLEPNDGTTSFIDMRSTFRRVAGTSTHAIEFSVVLSAVIPLGIYLALTSVRRRTLWWVCTALMGTALPMSVSRTAAVALGAVAIVLLTAWKGRRRIYASIVALAFLVVLRIALPGLLGTIKALFVWADADPSVTARGMDYDYVERLVAQNPVFGRGFGTFLPEQFDYLDNQYLLSAVETGLLGVASLLALFGAGAWACLRVRRCAGDPRDRELATALLASIAVAFVTCATFDFLSFSQARNLFFLQLGCAGALWRLQVRDAPPGHGSTDNDAPSVRAVHG